MSGASRPNILFAFADDWGRYASAYRQVEGDDTPNFLIETPNFDRIAREGVLFTNAFVPAPSCTPCRSSVLTGRYFWQTGRGAILQGAVWDESIPSWPLMLEESGYHIGHTYKVWGPGTPPNAPYGGERTAYNTAGVHFGDYSHHVTRRREEVGLKEARQEMLDEVRGNFDAFLAARPEDAPFAYWWGPTNTHRTWERGSGHALYGLEPDQLQGRLPAYLPDVPEIREDFCDYLGECLAVDMGLGILIERLEELGEMDNTFIVVSGDHGIPGMPRGKCNMYDQGSEVGLAMRLPKEIPPQRIVDDLVNIMDLAPTFLEAGGVKPPAEAAARSLMPLLRSGGHGQVEADRDHVVIGRERHVAGARDGYLPYPQRAIRTRDYLYIRNYAPDRWPMGDPRGLDDPELSPPPYEQLCRDTFACYADMDASPTKAWMIHHRGEAEVAASFQLGFGKFPAEELYSVRDDPHHLVNLVERPELQEMRRELSEKLEGILRQNRDPRLSEGDCSFDLAPFAGPLSD